MHSSLSSDAFSRSYVACTDWASLSRAVRRSTSRSSIDEMVQLYHCSEFPNGTRPPRHVRRVVFKRNDEIPSLLDAPDYLPFRDEAVDPNDLAQWMREGGGNAEDDDDADDVRGVDVQEVTKTIDATQPETAPTFSAETLKCAERIARAFRRYIARKRADKDAMEEMRRRIRADFSAQVAALGSQWPDARYRFVYRAIGPPLFVAVEFLWKRLRAAKKLAKTKLRVVAHEELENVEDALNVIS